MTGKLYIDGADAFTTYGIFVENGGYAGVVEWPALKTVDVNDWPEDDGVDADLSDPRLNTKDFKLSFCCVDYEKTVLLFQLLTDGAYHTFEFAEIGLTRKLRLVSQPNTQTIIPLQVFSLQFADDNYLKGYIREELIEIPSCRQRGFEIDSVDLSAYGVWIVSGTLNNIEKSPDVKKNLLVDASIIPGVIYEDSEVRLQ